MGFLNRNFHRSKGEPQASAKMTLEVAQRIVQDYGAVLESSPPPAGCVADVRSLPHSKDRIKEALILALRLTKDRRMRDQLKVAYVLLAHWQEGVGNEPVEVNLHDVQAHARLLEMARQVTSEQDILKAELQRLGLR